MFCTALLWKATWKLLRKNIPYAGAIPCLDQLGKKYLPKLLESHVKLFLHCFRSKTTWPFWKKTHTRTMYFSQDVSHVQSNKKSVKLKMLLLILYTLFSSSYVYRKNISAYSRFCPPVILGNTCWYLWRKLLERTIDGLSWGLCVVYWGTSADTSVFITTFCSTSILVLWEKRILALGKDCSSYISSSMFCFFRKYKMGGSIGGWYVAMRNPSWNLRYLCMGCVFCYSRVNLLRLCWVLWTQPNQIYFVSINFLNMIPILKTIHS